MIVSGGMRPPVPITVGAGSGLPVESTATVGEASSVVVRFPLETPPGRNSCTRPVTRTESPTVAVGADEVKTKMPSEVAGSASGFGSWIQKPFVLLAVTIPRTFTIWPLKGEMCVAPCTSWIGVAAVSVAKVKVKSAAIVSGGSFVSWSVTSAPTTVTLQLSPCTKSAVGSRVNVVGPPDTVAACEPLVPHEIENHESCTSTGSLNVIETFEPTGTSLALFAGTVAETLGATSALQSCTGEAELRGAGAPAVKSARLLSVSTHPAPLRRSAVVLVSAGVGLVSEQLAEP